VIGDGEGIAIASITELELAFEVGAPQFVGGYSARERRSGGAAARPGGRGDEPVAMENGVDCTLGRHADIAGQSERIFLTPQFGFSCLMATMRASRN